MPHISRIEGTTSYQQTCDTVPYKSYNHKGVSIIFCLWFPLQPSLVNWIEGKEAVRVISQRYELCHETDSDKLGTAECRDTTPLKRPVLLVGESQTFFQLVVSWQWSFKKQIKHCSCQNEETKLNKMQVLTRQRKRSTIFLFIAFCEYREQALLIVFLVHLSALICLL